MSETVQIVIASLAFSGLLAILFTVDKEWERVERMMRFGVDVEAHSFLGWLSVRKKKDKGHDKTGDDVEKGRK